MDMTGEYRIDAPRERVWAALNDAEVLRRCIPGCESVEKVSDTEFTAQATVKVGPVKAKFGGRVTLSDLDPPNGYRITGEGQGGAAGFGKGGAVVKLADDGAGTVLTYSAEAQVGGKLAQIGSRLIQGSAKKLADDFFAKFAEEVGGAAPVAAAPAAEAPEPAAVEPVAAEPVAAAAPVGTVKVETTVVQTTVTETVRAPAAAPMGFPGGLDDVVPSGRKGLRPMVWIPLVILFVLVLVLLAR